MGGKTTTRHRCGELIEPPDKPSYDTARRRNSEATRQPTCDTSGRNERESGADRKFAATTTSWGMRRMSFYPQLLMGQRRHARSDNSSTVGARMGTSERSPSARAVGAFVTEISAPSRRRRATSLGAAHRASRAISRERANSLTVFDARNRNWNSRSRCRTHERFAPAGTPKRMRR